MEKIEVIDWNKSFYKQIPFNIKEVNFLIENNYHQKNIHLKSFDNIYYKYFDNNNYHIFIMKLEDDYYLISISKFVFKLDQFSEFKKFIINFEKNNNYYKTIL